MPEAHTARRKDAHLDLCAEGEVEPAGNSTLLDCVNLVHNALPEMALDDVELGLTLWGKPLRAPLIVTGMTGGTERAREVNRDLAQVAERNGLAFGVGSQRAMAENPELARTFQVREVAPHVLLIGNIGLRQAIAMGVDGVRRLVDSIGADGLALHLNAAQELSQPEGDRDFRGGYSLVQALSAAFGDHFLVKETGCGIGPAVARRLVDCGVRTLDVSGLGGTSWVRVAVGLSVKIVASGGIRHGLDVAKALALGADLAGMALPLFRAQQTGGVAGADAAVRTVVAGLRQALLLTSSRTVADLRRSPRVVTSPLKDWMESL